MRKAAIQAVVVDVLLAVVAAARVNPTLAVALAAVAMKEKKHG
jgi:hypothetical protein